MKKQPITSVLAYESVDVEKHEKAILKTLEEIPNSTYKEIAKKLKWQDKVAVARRMSKLVEKELVVITGIRKCLESNRPCQTYKLSN